MSKGARTAVARRRAPKTMGSKSGGTGDDDADSAEHGFPQPESWQSLHGWLNGKGVGTASGAQRLSQTWHVIHRQLHASKTAATKRFHASKARVDALRHSLTRRRLLYMSERKKRKDAERAARLVVGLGSHQDTLNFTLGAALFGLMHFVAGAAPGLLPALNCLFFTLMMIFRTSYFVRRKWTFFLIDFCYWANIATVLHLMIFPQEDHLSAMVFAMCEGPLSGALVVWRFGWLFGSREHTFSTLMHLLPGLAVHCHRYYLGPKGWAPLLETARTLVSGSPQPTASWTHYVISDVGLGWRWHMAAPLTFYCAWQLCYYIVVQVFFRRFIKRNRYETSYTVLSDRAMKNEKGLWKWLIGGYPHSTKIVIFGLTQLVFTIATMLMAWPMFYSYRLSLAWQLVKLVVSLYYGGKMQCQVLPEKLSSRKVERYISQLATDGASVPQHEVPPPVPRSPGSITSPPAAMEHDSIGSKAELSRWDAPDETPLKQSPGHNHLADVPLEGDPEDVEDSEHSEEDQDEHAQQNAIGENRDLRNGRHGIVNPYKNKAPPAPFLVSNKGVNGLVGAAASGGSGSKGQEFAPAIEGDVYVN